MDGKNGLTLWVLGGTGVLFLYSAVKNKSPLTVLRDHLGVGAPAPAGAPPRDTADGGRVPSVGPSALSSGQIPPAYRTRGGTYIPSLAGGLVNA